MNQNTPRHSSRRNDTNNATVQNVTHAGLWLDRYPRKVLKKGEKLKKDPITGKEEEAPNVSVIKEAIKIKIPPLYDAYLKRWGMMLNEVGAKCGVATADAPLVVGLGDESVLETSITLHHTYGVPYLPGSALKGVAAAFTHLRLKEADWRKGGEAHRELFGDMEYAGSVYFLDAPLLLTEASERYPLRQDIMTVHHAAYYGGTRQKNKEGKEEIVPPTDFDQPNPVSFVSVRPKTEFRVALVGQEAWVNAAWEILTHALREFGIGAKTGSGYGRMTLK